MRTPRNDRLGADSDGGEGPERKCILSGDRDARAALIRLALAPPGLDPADPAACAVLPDVRARAPGRGAWIGVDRAELATALAKGKLKGALSRAFGPALGGAPLAIPADLPEQVEAALARVLTERLGIALKSGLLLLGSDRIAERARAGRVAWLAHAADASVDGVRKLDQAWRVGSDTEGSGRRGAILPLDRAALSVALGRDNVVHLALTDAAAAQRIATATERLVAFRGRAETNETGVAAPADLSAAPSAPLAGQAATTQ